VVRALDSVDLAILGPTASGKSRLALSLAHRMNAEIVSADSRQIYREISVGTGKLLPEEREGIPHHLLDLCPITEAFSAGDFVREARKAIAGIRARGKRVIVCGGTGLYVESLFSGIVDLPPRPPGQYEEYRQGLEAVPTDALYARLRESDPERATDLHPNDRVRILRALYLREEFSLPSAVLFESFRTQGVECGAIIGLDPGRENRQSLIESRVKAMFANGWIEEVEALLKGGVDPAAPGFNSLGYREVIAFLKGQMTRPALVEAVILKTRQYAKRQMTWFRHMEGIRWVAPGAGTTIPWSFSQIMVRSEKIAADTIDGIREGEPRHMSQGIKRSTPARNAVSVKRSNKERIGIIGGSGLYHLKGLSDLRPTVVETPWGQPSDPYMVGMIGEIPVAFLSRHGAGHRYLPGEINYRANIAGFVALGVRRILSVSAVGSLKESIVPGDMVVVDQFIDWTKGRPSTFYGQGAVGHTGFAHPICPDLAKTLVEACRSVKARHHGKGTYLCMEGPAFSTQAESFLYRQFNADVIGMTNVTEARLAREAGLCYATLALSTDFDCWHPDHDAVTVADVLAVMEKNVSTANRILERALETVGPAGGCKCQEAPKTALVTHPDSIPAATRNKLAFLGILKAEEGGRP
jgi:5'-methylthioadenosine phosphorylase